MAVGFQNPGTGFQFAREHQAMSAVDAAWPVGCSLEPVFEA